MHTLNTDRKVPNEFVHVVTVLSVSEISGEMQGEL